MKHMYKYLSKMMVVVILILPFTNGLALTKQLFICSYINCSDLEVNGFSSTNILLDCQLQGNGERFCFQSKRHENNNTAAAKSNKRTCLSPIVNKNFTINILFILNTSIVSNFDKYSVNFPSQSETSNSSSTNDNFEWCTFDLFFSIDPKQLKINLITTGRQDAYQSNTSPASDSASELTSTITPSVDSNKLEDTITCINSSSVSSTITTNQTAGKYASISLETNNELSISILEAISIHFSIIKQNIESNCVPTNLPQNLLSTSSSTEESSKETKVTILVPVVIVCFVAFSCVLIMRFCHDGESTLMIQAKVMKYHPEKDKQLLSIIYQQIHKDVGGEDVKEGSTKLENQRRGSYNHYQHNYNNNNCNINLNNNKHSHYDRKKRPSEQQNIYVNNTNISTQKTTHSKLTQNTKRVNNPKKLSTSASKGQMINSSIGSQPCCSKNLISYSLMSTVACGVAPMKQPSSGRH